MKSNNKPAKVTQNRGLVKVNDDYPFKLDVIHHLESRKKTSHEGDTMMGGRRVTIIEERWYTQFGFVQLHRDNREMLRGLSPSACKVFIHIALSLELGSHKVQLVPKDMPLTNKTLSKALLELSHARVIRKIPDTRNWYWVNVSILLVGTIDEQTVNEE